jgi:hypothetical protein
MTLFRGRSGGDDPATIASQQSRGSGVFTALFSSVALAVSGFSLWDSSLKSAQVGVFVPAVIQYSAPYQNSNFEMFEIPVTLTNDGAQTGTVLSMELAVTDPRTNQTKHFYASDFGRWTMQKTQAGAYERFAPISLAGRSSRTESVLFYTRGEEEKPAELVREIGAYKFKLSLELAEKLDGAGSGNPAVMFERELRGYDARAFQTGTLPMIAKDWRSSSNMP